MKDRILFIGPFPPPFSGDGVKNNFLRTGFENAGINNIDYLDTVPRGHSLLSVYWQIIKELIKYRTILFALNIRGRYFSIPIFSLLKMFTAKKGALYVVGGALGIQLKGCPLICRKLFVRCLNGLDFVFVESNQMVSELKQVGLKNTEVIYNARINDGFSIKPNNDQKRIIFLSRVTPTKGVFDLIDALKIVREEYNVNALLDIYGPVDEDIKDTLAQITTNSGGVVNYKGVLNPHEVQKVLSGYDLFALPTFHDGEGLPGVLIEAGFVGLPIIVSKINSLTEYFVPNEDVVFVDARNIPQIAGQIANVFSDGALAQKLSCNIQKAVKPFELGMVVDKSLNLLGQNGWVFPSKK